MKASNKKSLMGYDPLAWLGQEDESTKIDEVITATEGVQEQLVISDDESSLDQPDSMPEQTNNHEINETQNYKISIDTIVELPENQISNETRSEEVVEAIINLDSTLTIQHVVNLHEKLKKSYSTNDTIEINASHVLSIDTSTLQLLVALKKDALKQQKRVVFSAPSRRFIESAELLGLLEILEVDAYD
jgi:anti-anti-sigma regulatory factor